MIKTSYILDQEEMNHLKPWPKDIPTDPTHPNWEFCFAGEPMFICCPRTILYIKKE